MQLACPFRANATYSVHLLWGKASSIGVGTTSALAKPLDENVGPVESEILDVPDTLKMGDHIRVKSETNSMDLRYTTGSSVGHGYILNYEMVTMESHNPGTQ